MMKLENIMNSPYAPELAFRLSQSFGLHLQKESHIE